jgi:hypothetical protein
MNGDERVPELTEHLGQSVKSVSQSVSHSVTQSVSHSVTQCTLSQSVIQSFSHSVIQSFSHSVIQSFSQSVNQPLSQSVSQSVTVHIRSSTCSAVWLFLDYFIDYQQLFDSHKRVIWFPVAASSRPGQRLLRSRSTTCRSAASRLVDRCHMRLTTSHAPIEI